MMQHWHRILEEKMEEEKKAEKKVKKEKKPADPAKRKKDHHPFCDRSIYSLCDHIQCGCSKYSHADHDDSSRKRRYQTDDQYKWKCDLK